MLDKSVQMTNFVSSNILSNIRKKYWIKCWIGLLQPLWYLNVVCRSIPYYSRFRIESVNYDGSDRKLITSLNSKAYVFSMIFFNDSLFYSNWRTHTLEKYEIATNTTSTVMFSGYGDNNLYNVDIYEPKCKFD